MFVFILFYTPVLKLIKNTKLPTKYEHFFITFIVNSRVGHMRIYSPYKKKYGKHNELDFGD